MVSLSHRFVSPTRAKGAFFWLLLAACSSSSDSDPAQGSELGSGIALPPSLVAPESEAATQFAQLSQQLESVQSLDAAGLLQSYPSEHLATLSYEPTEAEFLDRVQASPLALNESELSVLGQRGFVVSSRQTFPTFLRGYAAIYENHLPVYVTADAMLDALHRSYDQILLTIERRVLRDDLETLLSSMIAATPELGASEEIRDETKLYLQVALGLLLESTPADSAPQVAEWIATATAAQGALSANLFGGSRAIDTSQFTPRGHYTRGLEGYFRAMIWLGRIDLRLIETLSDGSTVFRRTQYEISLAIAEAMNAASTERWQRIDNTVRAFVGESDYMTLPQVNEMVATLGGLEAARAATDDEVLAVLVKAGYGMQQIASHLMANDGLVKTLPLNRSFLLFGQRYVADSHVFSEVVYDRIGGRLMPNPLDAAFAAFGNNQAIAENAAELEQFAGYPGALARMRVLIDSHDEEFWNSNLYNLWSSALRSLSVSGGEDPTALGLPQVTGTEAWGQRMLNTQLGSWAQLRHDTVLYAKQSLTGTPGCDFPDAYIEPYPAFFNALGRYASRGEQLLQTLGSVGSLTEPLTDYFASLRNAAEILGEMANQQRDGIPHTEAQLAFINNAVRIEEENGGCVTIEVPDGWYADLFFNRAKSIELDATITDVHTQPADAAGNIVGKVLHVGTGLPRMMTVTVDTCAGPRAYTGMAFAYHEQITTDFERLTDEPWTNSLRQGARPADVPWVSSFVSE